ncbi:MAG: hypothetical protein IJS06_05880 [Prevotella sp.]|jgi:hypothetical protein|nr:hypothetical protein [Prevotella sp.]
MMRTFHQRFSLASKIAVLLATSLAFYLFWNKMFIFGVIVAFAVVVMVERVSHSSYSFVEKEGEQWLVVNHGRFSKTKTIRIAEVLKLTPMKTSFGMSHYLLMLYGNNHLMSLQPADEQSFCKELQRRMKIVETK